jgi:hypothetical protein
MPNEPETFKAILDHFSPEVQEIARAVRTLAYDVLPETVEVDWVQQKIAGLGTGPKKLTEHFAWIQPNKAHVNLGFNYGAELPDPDGLLEGTGNKFRHVKMRSLADVQRPAVRALLEVAITHRVPPPKGKA